MLGKTIWTRPGHVCKQVRFSASELPICQAPVRLTVVRVDSHPQLHHCFEVPLCMDFDAHHIHRYKECNTHAAGLNFILEHHQHVVLAGKLYQGLEANFPSRSAQGYAAHPMGLRAALQLYMWAIVQAHSDFTKHLSGRKEADLTKAVDSNLGFISRDWHSDPGTSNPNCNITRYSNGVAHDGKRCDHVIPKRRLPTVHQAIITLHVDTLIGEAKWKPAGTGLKADEITQKHAEIGHVGLGFARCLVWWCARFPSATKMAWRHTEFELTFHTAQDCHDCKQWLNSLGLMLQL